MKKGGRSKSKSRIQLTIENRLVQALYGGASVTIHVKFKKWKTEIGEPLRVRATLQRTN